MKMSAVRESRVKIVSQTVSQGASPKIEATRNCYRPGDQGAEPPENRPLKSKDTGKQGKGKEQGRDHLKSMSEEPSRRQDEEVEQQEDEHYRKAAFFGPEIEESGQGVNVLEWLCA